MKINKLTVENFKGVVFAEINPTSNTVIIYGKNGAGKSSIMDAVDTILVGKSKKITEPIRKGQGKATITAEIGEYTIKRVFTEKSDRFEIVNKDGMKSNQQTMIKDLVGDRGIDPFEMFNQPIAKQKELLLELTGLGIKLDKIDIKAKKIYDDRVLIGRERDALPLYTEEVIKENLTTAEKEEDSIKSLTATLETEGNVYMDYINAQQNIVTAQERRKKLKIEFNELGKKITKLSEVKKPTSDLKEIKIRLNKAEEHNSEIREAKLLLNTYKARNDKEIDYEEKTNELRALKAKKEKLLLDSKMPIDGLTIEENGVQFNGIPYQQLATSEQLKVSMSIAIAIKSKVEVARIMDGPLLDKDNMEIIKEMAKKHDFQIWIETIKAPDVGKGWLIKEGKINL